MPPRKTHDSFMKEVEDRYGDEYTILGEYAHTHSPILIRHNICGNEWDTTAPYDFLKPRANTCPKCSHQSWAFTPKEYSDRVLKETNGEYKVLSTYVNNKTKVTYKHIECGKVWEARPDAFNNGHRCPACGIKLSKLEKAVEEILKKFDITYIPQATSDTLRHINPLYIDFYLTDFDIAIECDGEQHYRTKRGGSEEFRQTLLRDRVKYEWCIANNVRLVRIPAMLPPRDYATYILKFLFENGVIELSDIDGSNDSV